MLEELQNQRRVDRIILSSSMRESFAIVGQRVRVDGKDVDIRLFQQPIDERSARGFEADVERGGGMLLPPVIKPLSQRFGRVFNGAPMGFAFWVKDREGVLTIGPVNPYEQTWSRGVLGLERGVRIGRGIGEPSVVSGPSISCGWLIPS